MAEPSILERIVAQRRTDVAATKRERPLATLIREAERAPAPLDVLDRLRAEPGVAVMAEIKRASPSRGPIAPHVDAYEQARRYAEAGAAVISVLTEPTWFLGSLDDLRAARRAAEGVEPRPALLRKDFVVDAYQVAEARAAGADTVLLIVACLSDPDLGELISAARELGMEPLVEVNSEEEMERAAATGARFIGINNRDLRTFTVDLDTTVRVARAAPPTAFLAALSGVRGRKDVERFVRAGARAVLVGEALMESADPAALIRELRAVPVP